MNMTGFVLFWYLSGFKFPWGHAHKTKSWYLLEFTFKNPTSTPVTFIWEPPRGLSIGSPVFDATFYGELAETGGYIEQPDCEYESVLELFRFMYSDEVNLNESNVIGVLYSAKKYMVHSLVKKCKEYLEG